MAVVGRLAGSHIVLPSLSLGKRLKNGRGKNLFLFDFLKSRFEKTFQRAMYFILFFVFISALTLNYLFEILLLRMPRYEGMSKQNLTYNQEVWDAYFFSS